MMRVTGWKTCSVALFTLNVRLAFEIEPARSSSRFCAVVTFEPIRGVIVLMPVTVTVGFATEAVGIR